MKFLGLFHIPFTQKEATQTETQIPLNQKNTKAYGSGYDGGYYGSNYRSDGSKWLGGISGTHNHMLYNHWRLRNNSRNAYQDSVHAHSIVKRWADSKADTGLKIDCNPDFNVLGITPENAQKWAADVESRFNLWAHDKNACRSAVMNFNQSHRLYSIGDDRDGENFIRLYYSKDSNLLNPLQFEFLDPNQIRGNAYTNTLGPYAQDDGIIRDEKGREKTYKVWISKKVNNRYVFDYVDIPRVGEKSKRIMMIHGFTPEFAGQGRGFPKLTHVLQEFQNLTDFTSSQIMKAIKQSSIYLTMENKQQDPSNPFEDLPIEPPGAEGYGVAADGEEECDPTTATADGCDFQYDAIPNANIDVPGGVGVFNTRMGDVLKPFENTSPSDSFGDFVHAFMKNICASTGMPIEVLEMKFSSSFSAARGALIMFWRVAMIWREEMASDYLNPVFEMWLSGEIAAGRVKAPGWSDPILRKAWLNCSWFGAPMPNIDPLRTAKGEKEYLEMNYTTGDRGAREHNGSDFKTNVVKNKKSFKEMAVPPWSKSKQQRGGLSNV